MRKVVQIVERLRARTAIDPIAWRGAARALILAGIVVALWLFISLAVPAGSLERTLGVLAALGIAVAVALGAQLLTVLLRRGELRFWWGFWLTFATLALGFGMVAAPAGALALIGAVLAATMLLGAGIALLRSRGAVWRAIVPVVLGGAGLLAIVVLLLVPGWPTKADVPREHTAAQLTLDDPGKSGAYRVRTLTYGSGADRQRNEFGAGAELKTAPVDGSKVVDGWSGPAGWARTRYWGFDAKALPLQGRVWYPETDAQDALPFPLVLIVHGNHDMEDFSDPGYAYLGELFASRGFVAVSVDENFLNSSYADLLGGFDGGLKKENDARGWLLLEHLKQFRAWNATEGNPFHGRVDLDRVVLIGHSRGGEAVAHAALFNRLPFFPDDGRVAFDYRFGIKGLIAIAPADRQYQPRGRHTHVHDVDYLVLQGSNDGDVQSFMGSAQFARVDFPNCRTCFKSAIYLLGANHGQFNTAWGRDDLGPLWGSILNLTPIMDPFAQRRAGAALMSAFLEVALHGRDDYRAFLDDPATGKAWLPDGLEHVSRSQSGADAVLSDYEEDDDLATGSAPDVKIAATGLTRWREIEVPLKWDTLESEAAEIGWDRGEADAAPQYSISFEPRSRAIVGVRGVSFAAAMSEASPRADENADWTVPDSLDFSVEVEDREGHTAAVALSSLAPLYKPVARPTRKFAIFDRSPPSEPVLQRFAFPLSSFTGVDPATVTAVRLRFDASKAGMIYLDDVALERDR